MKYTEVCLFSPTVTAANRSGTETLGGSQRWRSSRTTDRLAQREKNREQKRRYGSAVEYTCIDTQQAAKEAFERRRASESACGDATTLTEGWA